MNAPFYKETSMYVSAIAYDCVDDTYLNSATINLQIFKFDLLTSLYGPFQMVYKPGSNGLYEHTVPKTFDFGSETGGELVITIDNGDEESSRDIIRLLFKDRRP